ncbi:MAG: hypothetical protein HZA12_06690 [Nitrospirae bacterium]|nr:hypothetical protein [Nitrospirota bacterium]
MHIVFLERKLKDGKFEITIRQGREELKRLIGRKYVFPEKLVLTKQQRDENHDCLKDILTGAFCLQEFENVTYVVKNENGDIIEDYYKSIYDDIGGGLRM